MPAAACVPRCRCSIVSREEPVLKKSLIIAAAVAPVVIVSAIAQQSAIKRTPLQTVDFPPGFNVVSAIAEIAPGNCAGRHTHPGVESIYVMEGALLLKIESGPAGSRERR